ncbi:tetratricopeptide repeat protein [Zavarzinia sp. CC-PAN008]|uniref:tetratricopeptide repeat protein n=1 Tax=Zavarzinia sp. CC-PAN008 TaxID=3243332 RepID=UPI003F74800D
MQPHLTDGDAHAAEGRWQEALAAYHAAHDAAPDAPEPLFALARAATAMGQDDHATALYRLLLDRQPGSVEIANNLGNALRRVGDTGAAIEVFRTALALAPQEPVLWTNLGVVLLDTGDHDNARIFLGEALRLNAQHAPALANLAELEWRLGNHEAALPLLDAAVELLPDHAQLRLNRAVSLLSLGRLGEGWDAYESRLDPAMPRAPIHGLDLPRWDGIVRPGLHLLVVAEQGLGDQLLFLSCLPDLIATGMTITLDLDQRLESLIARTWPQVRTHGFWMIPENGRPRFFYEWLERPGAQDQTPVDAWVPIGSLPGLFRRDIADFERAPNLLQVDPIRRTEWLERLAELPSGLRVGICWRSMIQGTERRVNYATLEDWAPILAVPGVTFVNLQYDDPREELDRWMAAGGAPIFHYTDLDQIRDLEETAALTAALDLVITAPTSVSAMAGALGVPSLRVAAGPGWPELGTTRYPFQPSVTPLVPKVFGDLSDAIAQAAAVLAAQAQAHHA